MSTTEYALLGFTFICIALLIFDLYKFKRITARSVGFYAVATVAIAIQQLATHGLKIAAIGSCITAIFSIAWFFIQRYEERKRIEK